MAIAEPKGHECLEPCASPPSLSEAHTSESHDVHNGI